MRAGSGGAAWAIPWGCFMVGSRMPCVSSGMSCVCSRPSCVPFGMSCVCSRPSCVPLEMSCVRSRLLFAACAPNRTACVMFRSYSAVGRDRHSCVLESLVRLSGFMSSLLACAFLCGYPDGERRRRGERSWRRGLCTLLRKTLGFAAFSAGSPLGLRAPDCAKEPLAPWTLFI